MVNEIRDALDDALQTDSLKHFVDAITSIATFGSMFAWLNAELPILTMWATFIATSLSILWWVYRFYSEVHRHMKKAKYGAQ